MPHEQVFKETVMIPQLGLPAEVFGETRASGIGFNDLHIHLAVFQEFQGHKSRMAVSKDRIGA